jgi:hypothetical protein
MAITKRSVKGSALTFAEMDANWDEAAAPSGYTEGSSVATTSGTSIDVTGIPAGTTSILVYIEGLSNAANFSPGLTIGASSGFETSGYDTNLKFFSTAITSESSTVDFAVATSPQWNGSEVADGLFELTLIDSSAFTWFCKADIQRLTTVYYMSMGVKSLSAELDRFSLVTSYGTGAWDAGTLYYWYK